MPEITRSDPEQDPAIIILRRALKALRATLRRGDLPPKKLIELDRRETELEREINRIRTRFYTHTGL